MTNLNLRPLHVFGLTETYGPITKGYYMPAWDSIPVRERYQRMVRQGHGFVTSLLIRVIRTGSPEGEIALEHPYLFVAPRSMNLDGP